MFYRYVFLTLGIFLAVTSIVYLSDSSSSPAQPLYVTPAGSSREPRSWRPITTSKSILSTNDSRCVVSNQPDGQRFLKCASETMTCRKETFRKCPPQLTKHASTKASCPDEQAFRVMMVERAALVREQCMKHDVLYQAPKEIFFYDKVGKEGFTWCPVYKAGSSSTNAHLCPLYYDDTTCHDRTKNTAIMWRSKEEFLPLQAGLRTPSLLIVRHPFERLLSAFRDKIQTPDPSEPYIAPIMQNAIAPHRLIPASLIPHKEVLVNQAVIEVTNFLQTNPQKKGQYISIEVSANPYVKPISATFEEFVRAVLMGWSNEHWAPVSRFCAPCSNRYDYILKVEEFDCEFERFLGMIGAPESVHGERNAYVENNKNPARAGRNNSDFYEYFGSLPDNLLKALHEWYRLDCESFGYDCEKTLCEIAEWKRTTIS